MNKKKLFIINFILLFGLLIKVNAHVHWIMPIKQGSSMMQLCNGHDFPASRQSVSDKMIYKIKVLDTTYLITT